MSTASEIVSFFASLDPVHKIGETFGFVRLLCTKRGFVRLQANALDRVCLDRLGYASWPASSSRSKRRRDTTSVAVIADEAAFWHSDEDAANPDTAILDAVRPSLATTGGPMIIISTPYARRGVVFETWAKHFGGRGDPKILVAQGTSRDFNPSLPTAICAFRPKTGVEGLCSLMGQWGALLGVDASRCRYSLR
jgi:hypothetical protein